MTDKKRSPTITVGELRARFEGVPDDWTVDFSGLTFYRAKRRADSHLQIEFDQSVYRDLTGRVVVENHEQSATAAASALPPSAR